MWRRAVRVWHKPGWVAQPVVIRRWHLLISGLLVGSLLAGVVTFGAYILDDKLDDDVQQRRTEDNQKSISE